MHTEQPLLFDNDARSLDALAVEAVSEADLSYCKFLSANDTGATGGHQSGVLISKSAWPLMFEIPYESENISKRRVTVRWQDGSETTSTFTHYSSKHESRLTGFGRGFSFLKPSDTGALFVLARRDPDYYCAFILDGDDAVDAFLSALGMGPQDAGGLIDRHGIIESPEVAERDEIESYVRSLHLTPDGDFPASIAVSEMARKIQSHVYDHDERLISNPDLKLVEFTRIEYAIFRSMESNCYGPSVRAGFEDLESFVRLANSLLNRRKSRAGKSFEHHLASLFSSNGLPFEEQVRTEGNKKPDFVFPSGDAYHDFAYPVDKLVVLAAKTTCKDRWRQILTEADRMDGRTKFLITMQQGNSPEQLHEMREDQVQLIVPKQYIGCYPREFQSDIWTLRRFIDYVRSVVF